MGRNSPALWARQAHIGASNRQLLEHERRERLPPKIGFVYLIVPETPQNVVEHISEIREALDPLGLLEFNIADSSIEPKLTKSLAPQRWVLHNTVTYSPRVLRRMLEAISFAYQNSVIHVMKQDEHVAPFLFDEMFTEFPVVSVFSYLPEAEIPIVYPKSVASGILFHKTYVAYVTRGLASMSSHPLPATYSASYRGSFQPVSLGILGHDKAQIPSRALGAFPGDGRWVLDVSSMPEKRVYGEAWFELLRDSYAVISSESGSNCFDLDGSLSRLTAEFESVHGTFTYSDADTYALYEKTVLCRFERNVRGGTFAPRNLEAAVICRPQILVEGDYDGLFKDSESAVFVRRDFANFRNLLEALEDRDFAQGLAVNAREAVLGNRQLKMSALTDLLLEVISRHNPVSPVLTTEDPIRGSRTFLPLSKENPDRALFRFAYVCNFYLLLAIKKLLRSTPGSWVAWLAFRRNPSK